MLARLNGLTRSWQGRIALAALALAALVAFNWLTKRERCKVISYPPVKAASGGRSVVTQQTDCDVGFGIGGDVFALMLSREGEAPKPIFQAEVSPIVKWVDDRTLEVSIAAIAKISRSDHEAAGVKIRYVVPEQLMPGALEKRLAGGGLERDASDQSGESAEKTRAFLAWAKANVDPMPSPR